MDMLVIGKGVNTNIVVTLNEKSGTGTHYLFIFTSRSSNETVYLIVDKTNDQSQHTYRYNKFQVTASTFANKPEGIWNYKVYEQSSDVNTDPTGLTLVEEGFAKVVSTPTAAAMYSDGNLTYTMYDG